LTTEFLPFAERQLAAIRVGGPGVALRKLTYAFGVLLAIPVVLIARVIRPLVWLRFGYLPSHRIGHYVANVEVYLCERDAGLHGRRICDLFYHGRHVCNEQIRTMWDRTVHVSEFARWADAVNRRIPGGRRHSLQQLWRSDQDSDVHGVLLNTAPHIAFTAAEDDRGRAALAAMGVPTDMPFVGFHARDAAYLRATLPRQDWRGHDYRDCDIERFRPAANELTRRGYVALRMGAIVEQPFDTSNPRVIDYATRYRSDFLDIYLLANCAFFLGTESGICRVAQAFRRPVAFANWTLFAYNDYSGPRDLFTPRRFWLKRERRFMTFNEIILASAVSTFQRTEQYEAFGLELVDSTADEVTALVVEMDGRVKSTWHTTDEDEHLQGRFRQLFAVREPARAIRARIGAEFLRQNRELLE
jgi:putative glycosyltransferase (TIGR04372 family)